MEKFDMDMYYYMDLNAKVHTILKVDCEVNLKLEGQLLGEKRMEVVDDITFYQWVRDNGT